MPKRKDTPTPESEEEIEIGSEKDESKKQQFRNGQNDSDSEEEDVHFGSVETLNEMIEDSEDEEEISFNEDAKQDQVEIGNTNPQLC